MNSKTTLDSNDWLKIEQDIQNAGNTIDSVIHLLQTVAPENRELINTLNQMSPSNRASTMANAFKKIDKKI